MRVAGILDCSVGACPPASYQGTLPVLGEGVVLRSQAWVLPVEVIC